MSIEQLDLLLCDTYQMDAWFPFGWKWKKELEKSSYSVWAIDEVEKIHRRIDLSKEIWID